VPILHMCPPVVDEDVCPGEGSCYRGASTVPGLCHQSKPLPIQLWWPDSAQERRDLDHILPGARSRSHVVVRVRR
jgi:hypothetical protein